MTTEPPELEQLLTPEQIRVLEQELRKVLQREHGEVTLFINAGKIRYIRTTTSREMNVGRTSKQL